MKKFKETDRVRETDREKMRVKAEMVYMWNVAKEKKEEKGN